MLIGEIASLHFEASYHFLCCLVIGQQPCEVYVERAVCPMVCTRRISKVARVRPYSIPFVGARSSEVVGGCFVATLDVQQLYRLIVVVHFGRWKLANYSFGRWISLKDGFGVKVGCCWEIGREH